MGHALTHTMHSNLLEKYTLTPCLFRNLRARLRHIGRSLNVVIHHLQADLTTGHTSLEFLAYPNFTRCAHDMSVICS